MTRSQAVETAASLLGSLARRDHPLGALTTYRVGGTASLFVSLESEAVLAQLARAVAESGIEVLVIGKGSNTIVADAGFDGLAVQLGDAFSAVEIDAAAGTATAGGAASFPILARRSASGGTTGLEWAVGVPGSVGGAVRMNAGGHGSDVASCLVSARVASLGDGAVEERLPQDLALGYRRSAVAADEVVLAATFSVSPAPREECDERIRQIVSWRRAHQPGGQNAGSVFVNPEHDSAGRLVDEAGLKGLRHGTAEVSPKHANFIQADDGGSADDVIELVGIVRQLVEERLGVLLQSEVRIVGVPR